MTSWYDHKFDIRCIKFIISDLLICIIKTTKKSWDLLREVRIYYVRIIIIFYFIKHSHVNETFFMKIEGLYNGPMLWILDISNIFYYYEAKFVLLKSLRW